MTYSFGTRSTNALLTVREDLRAVAYEAMKLQVYDFAIICGWRSEEDQTTAYMTGASRVRWPDSQHNTTDGQGNPRSNAFDFAPWCRLESGTMGIPWMDTHAFAVLGGIFVAIGSYMGIPIRYGGDWDMDGLSTDQSLMDWGHVEVLNR